MAKDWKARLQRIMDERKLNMKELSLLAKLNETAVRDALKRRQGANINTIAAIAKALGMSLAEFYDGDEVLFQRIPIIGALSAGEGWEPFDDRLGEIELKVDGEPVAIEVKGDSMMPVYRNGDLLIGTKKSGPRADNLVGLDCIVTTEDGKRYVKFLARGAMRGRFNLRSYNPAHKDVENVKLAWAAPIVWVRRSQR